jgi:hypothetical protein
MIFSSLAPAHDLIPIYGEKMHSERLYERGWNQRTECPDGRRPTKVWKEILIFYTSFTKQILFRELLLSVITQRVDVISYPRSWTTNQSHPQGSIVEKLKSHEVCSTADMWWTLKTLDFISRKTSTPRDNNFFYVIHQASELPGD